MKLLDILFWPFKIIRFIIFMCIGCLLVGWFGHSLVTRTIHTFSGVETNATLIAQIDKCEIVGKKSHRGKQVLIKSGCPEAAQIANRDFGEGNYRLSKKTDLEISFPIANEGAIKTIASSSDLHVSKLPLKEKFKVVYNPTTPSDVQLSLSLDIIIFYVLCIILGLVFISSALYNLIMGQSLMFTMLEKSMKKDESYSVPYKRKDPHF